MKRILGLIVGLLLTSALPALAQSDVTVYATAQRFERGLMIWRSDTAMIYVLADSGRAYSFPASVYGRLPDNPIPASQGRIRPIFGFGKIWGNRVDIRSALGWPVRGELGFNMRIISTYGATYLRQLDGTIYQVNDNGRWSLAPGFPSSAPIPPAGPSIARFDVEPMTVAPGGSITVSWSISGAQQAIIEVYYLGSGEMASNYFGVPAAGSVNVPVAPNAASDLKVVLTAANPNPNPPYGFIRYAATEKVVHVSSVVEHSIITYAAFQPYQNGFMLWRSDNGNIDVFYNSGQHEAFSTGAYAAYPDNPYFNPPAGLVRPINGFGRLWGGFDRVRTGLGWATTWETGYQLTLGFAEGAPVSFSLPDGRVAHASFSGTWSAS